jgi:hypothetical protein
MFRVPSRSIAMAVGLALLASAALAAEPKPPEKPAPPTPEQRATMATMHRQMADCLVSDRPIEECRAQMQAACAQSGMMGDAGCGMGRGGRMMGGPTPMRAKPPAPKQ